MSKQKIRTNKDTGFALCDHCDNFASKEYSEMVGWIACAPCVTGEADSFDEQADFFKPQDITDEELLADYRIPK